MQINFTNEQYKDLIFITHIANSVMGILGDCVSEKYKEKSDQWEKFEEYLISLAKYFNYENNVEKFMERDLLKDKMYEKFNEIIDDYNEYIFWDELTIQMGKRDFEREITTADTEYIKINHWLPERIGDYYRKYEDEFEKNGIERLEIKNKKGS